MNNIAGDFGEFYNPDKYTEYDLPRATRRRIKNNYKIPPELVKEIMKLVSKQVIDVCIDQYSVGVSYVLWKEFGYGKKRLPNIMIEIENFFSKIEDGHVNLEACRKELEEANVRIPRSIRYSDIGE